jgi:endonuclease YncB( thermonuclease family)
MTIVRPIFPTFIGVLLVGAVACSSVAGTAAELTSTATSNETASAAFTEAMCTRVIDGDTIEVNIDGETYMVRYIGIDTPEMDDNRSEYRALAEEATQANRDMVEGENVSLEKDVSETDQYDRLLRYVFVGYNLVNAELVSDGYAWAKSYPPDTKYDALFHDLETEAENGGLGVWSLP